jgi:fido (protein-threonine AMPylation protein)
MAKDPYVYPGSGVLRNNLEIHDQQELSQAEADIVRAALAVLAGSPLPGDYDLAHWRAFLSQLAGQTGHRISWERVDHQQSFAANVASLNGQNEQLRALLEPVVDMPQR